MNQNPFPVTAYLGPEYFCNRSAEIDVFKEDLNGFLKRGEKQAALNDILDILEKQKYPNYIAIDEFKQISEYPESNTEQILRSHFQHLTNSWFIYSEARDIFQLQCFQIHPGLSTKAVDSYPLAASTDSILQLQESADPGPVPSAGCDWSGRNRH